MFKKFCTLCKSQIMAGATIDGGNYYHLNCYERMHSETTLKSGNTGLHPKKGTPSGRGQGATNEALPDMPEALPTLRHVG